MALYHVYGSVQTSFFLSTDRLREQELVISAALVEKRAIVAEMLGVPQQDFLNIAEVCAHHRLVSVRLAAMA